MNYLLTVTSKPLYPLCFDTKNSVNGSDIANGNYIYGYNQEPLIYNDTNNSNISFEKLLTYDVIKTVGGGLLVSEKLKKIIIENFLDDIQLFDTFFLYKGKECTSYNAINIHNKMECYDLDQCIYTNDTIDEDDEYDFLKVQIKTAPLEEYGVIHNIVRNSFDNEIIVSDFFVKKIRESKINSIKFLSNKDLLKYELF
jgi:hypothetical protein